MAAMQHSPLAGAALLFLLILAVFGIPIFVVLKDVSVRAQSNAELRDEVERDVHNELMPAIEAAFAQGMEYARQVGLGVVDLDADDDTLNAVAL